MNRRTGMLLAGVVIMLLAVGTGCQNWQKKYETCNAEYQNLQALFDAAQQSLSQCESERDQYAQQLGMTQRDLAEARKSRATPQPTGDFPGEDVRYDAAKGTITVTLESGVLFDSGKADLKNDAKTRLNNIANVIKQKYSGKEVSVVGHTDTDPIKKSKWKDNWELSSQRALAVTRYLISRGIAAEQLTAAGRGEFQPVGGDKAANRRVEIVVHMYK
ncbi:MAG: OmpA family protein [Sedimentisphaerales bacterium]|nr:OmpA family protein [Sedimentisphaerales bacterium]